MVSHPMRRFISNFKSYNNNTVPSNSQAPFASSCLREAMSEDIPTQAANIANSLARFSDLPPEIRVKTWQAALAAEKEPNFIEARDLAPNVSIDGRPLYLRSRRGVSARLAHTNREARHEVLRDDESFVMRYMKQILVRTPISLYSDQSQRRRRHDTIGQRVMFDSHDDFLALDWTQLGFLQRKEEQWFIEGIERVKKLVLLLAPCRYSGMHWYGTVHECHPQCASMESLGLLLDAFTGVEELYVEYKDKDWMRQTGSIVGYEVVSTEENTLHRAWDYRWGFLLAKPYVQKRRKDQGKSALRTMALVRLQRHGS